VHDFLLKFVILVVAIEPRPIVGLKIADEPFNRARNCLAEMDISKGRNIMMT
jgi:hypothetical protein